MLPLFITLETALINGIEHGGNQWKHLFALPLPRHTIYLAKLFTAQALVALSTFALCVMIVLSGLALGKLRPEMANVGPIPFFWILQHAALVWLASWLILAIHMWVSIRWSGFALSLGVGIGGVFFALFAASAKMGKFYPWLLPVNIFSDAEGRFAVALVLGAVGGAVAVVAGCLEFTRRDVV
jgi:hypothetical protein